MNKEQLEYVQTQFDNGVSPDDLRAVMHEAGYDDELIAELFAAVQNETPLSVSQGDEVSTNHALQLPSYGEFIYQSWAISYPLLLVSVVGVVGWSTVTAALITFSDNYIIESLSGWMAALTGLISLYLLATILAVMLRTDCTTVSDGLKWANKNFASFWWLSIIMALVQLSAFFLLIVPGLIVAWYIVLTYPVRVVEGQKGFQAMVRSTALVYGYWWSVFGRVMWLTITSIPLFFISFLIMFVVNSWLSLDANNVWLTAPLWFANGVILVVYANAVSILYTHLAVGRGTQVESKGSVRWLYIIFAILAPVVILLLLIGTVVLPGLNEARDAAQDASQMMTLSSARAEAEIYYNMNNESYDGLCADISLDITCESNASSYRLSALTGREIVCADSIENEIVTVTSLPENSLQCR